MSCVTCSHENVAFQYEDEPKLLFCSEMCGAINYQTLIGNGGLLSREAFTNYALKLNPVDLTRLCSAHSQLKKLCRDDGFKTSYVNVWAEELKELMTESSRFIVLKKNDGRLLSLIKQWFIPMKHYYGIEILINDVINLHLCILRVQLDTLEYLLVNGLDPNHLSKYGGKSLLHRLVEVRTPRIDLVILLMDYGANPAIPDIKEMNALNAAEQMLSYFYNLYNNNNIDDYRKQIKIFTELLKVLKHKY